MAGELVDGHDAARKMSGSLVAASQATSNPMM
jgi:hypothetical protein